MACAAAVTSRQIAVDLNRTIIGAAVKDLEIAELHEAAEDFAAEILSEAVVVISNVVVAVEMGTGKASSEVAEIGVRDAPGAAPRPAEGVATGNVPACVYPFLAIRQSVVGRRFICFSHINVVFCNALLFKSALKGKLCENIKIIILWFYFTVKGFYMIHS